MPTFMLAPLVGRYLSFAEREEIALLQRAGLGVREIARRLGRVAVDDLAGAAPQRGDARRQARVPGVGRAVEGRAGGAAPEDRRSSPPTSGCASTCRSGWPARSAARTGHAVPGPDGAVEGPQQAASPGPPVGDGMEPGADRQPAEDRLPR